MPKPKKELQKRYALAIEKVGCCVCRREMNLHGYNIQIHHLRGVAYNSGIGLKSRQWITLCANHHLTSNDSYHHAPFEFEEKHGSQQILWEWLQKELENES